MAKLLSINFKDSKIFASLELSKDEYALFKHERDLLTFPASSMDFTLVTGTLGNSNRIMLPNKILKRNEIATLLKNVPSKIVKTKKGKYLIIQLEETIHHIPKFAD